MVIETISALKDKLYWDTGEHVTAVKQVGENLNERQYKVIKYQVWENSKTGESKLEPLGSDDSVTVPEEDVMDEGVELDGEFVPFVDNAEEYHL